MKQIAWEKTAYEAGHTFGQNFDMQTLLPFLFDGQRMEFGKACLQICRRVYPSVVEEMEGIAQGAGVELEKLSAFLFGIYAFPPFQGCSCFAAADEEEIFFGRNSDFLPAAKEQSLSSIYKIEGKKSFLANSNHPGPGGGRCQRGRLGGGADLFVSNSAQAGAECGPAGGATCWSTVPACRKRLRLWVRCPFPRCRR